MYVHSHEKRRISACFHFNVFLSSSVSRLWQASLTFFCLHGTRNSMLGILLLFRVHNWVLKKKSKSFLVLLGLSLILWEIEWRLDAKMLSITGQLSRSTRVWGNTHQLLRLSSRSCAPHFPDYLRPIKIKLQKFHFLNPKIHYCGSPLQRAVMRHLRAAR